MQIVARLDEVPFTPTRAVIINCGTKWVSSLALASALVHVNCPVLVIDCQSKDGSHDHFNWLARRYKLRFHWLTWPLRPHPVTLDALFHEIRSDSVLLIDSDLEIRTGSVFEAMCSALASSESAYGAGFVHGPCWLGMEHGLPAYTGYYSERMWIPFVLLRTEVIRHALDAGLSFSNRRPYLEIPNHPTLSRLIGYRYRIRGLRRLRISLRRPNGGVGVTEVDGRRPAFVDYDTGADLHKGLQDRGYHFAGLPQEQWGDVYHHHGVTRARLARVLRRAAKGLRLASIDAGTPQTSVLSDIKTRLSEIYGIRAADGDT